MVRVGEYFHFQWRLIFCFGTEEREAVMATYRLAEILKSRTDLSDEEIERMDEEEAWQRIQANTSEPSVDDPRGEHEHC